MELINCIVAPSWPESQLRVDIIGRYRILSGPKWGSLASWLLPASCLGASRGLGSSCRQNSWGLDGRTPKGNSYHYIANFDFRYQGVEQTSFLLANMVSS
jgi:hypothetical protein